MLLLVAGSESVLHPFSGSQRRKLEVPVHLGVRLGVSLLLPF